MAGRLNILGKHHIGVATGDEDIRTDNLCGIAVADPQQLWMNWNSAATGGRFNLLLVTIIIDIKNNKAQISHLPFVNRGLNTKAIKRVIFLVVLTSHPSPNSHAWHAAPYSPPHPPYELSFPLPSFNVNHVWPVKDELPSLRELPEGAI